LLLADYRVNPSDDNNGALREAVKNKHSDIIIKLWLNKKVKSTLRDSFKINLKKNDINLYNELIQKNIKFKIGNF
jgi:hypothetical protein